MKIAFLNLCIEGETKTGCKLVFRNQPLDTNGFEKMLKCPPPSRKLSIKIGTSNHFPVLLNHSGLIGTSYSRTKQ